MLEPVYVDDPHPLAHNEERQVINDLQEEMQTKITLPGGAQTGDLLRWDGEQWLTTETRFFEGNGRPDGTIAAPVGSRYIDKTGAQGAVEWVKRAGADSNQGWICLAGDTGWQSLVSKIDRGNGLVHSAQIRRIGSSVDVYLDLTMPTNRMQPGTTTWIMFPSLAGYSPGLYRYGILTDNAELASTGSAINAEGGLILTGVVGGKRDRYSGMWTTSDAWPSSLPGPVV
jgi:hypothetical protein